MLPQIGRAALVPLWTAQLLTGTKSFERNARDRQPAAEPARAARRRGSRSPHGSPTRAAAGSTSSFGRGPRRFRRATVL